MSAASVTAACPLCAGALKPGGYGKDAPKDLDGWPLLHCPVCQHTCCPAAYEVAADYDALYGAEYYAQQVAPLRDPARHAELALLPPYLAFFRELGPARGRTLLDVGCGAGRFLLAARLAGWQVRGVEPAAQAVTAATSTGLWLPVTQQTPEQLTAREDRFDVVTLFDVLEHVADPVALLRSVLPLLKPGGDLFVTVPNWDSPLMQHAQRADWQPPVHLQFFTLTSLLAAIPSADDAALALHSGCISSDPAPPPRYGPQWLRWLSRRLRGHPVHRPQLWLHARSKPLEP